MRNASPIFMAIQHVYTNTEKTNRGFNHKGEAQDPGIQALYLFQLHCMKHESGVGIFDQLPETGLVFK